MRTGAAIKNRNTDTSILQPKSVLPPVLARRSGVSVWAKCKAAKGEDEGAYSST